MRRSKILEKINRLRAQYQQRLITARNKESARERRRVSALVGRGGYDHVKALRFLVNYYGFAPHVEHAINRQKKGKA